MNIAFAITGYAITGYVDIESIINIICCIIEITDQPFNWV